MLFSALRDGSRHLRAMQSMLRISHRPSSRGASAWLQELAVLILEIMLCAHALSAWSRRALL